MTADNKYSLINRKNSTQPIHMILSENLKTFSGFPYTFLKSRLNFEDFQKKYDPHS